MKRTPFLVMLGLTATLVLGGCGDDNADSGFSRDSDPAEVIEGYVTAYNAQDIDRVMAFFTEDAVLIDGVERIEGTEAIRAEELGGFGVQAPGGEAFSISNLVVTGNTVTFDNHFKGTAHTCVGTGNEAVVDDGQIVEWKFASIDCD